MSGNFAALAQYIASLRKLQTASKKTDTVKQSAYTDAINILTALIESETKTPAMLSVAINILTTIQNQNFPSTGSWCLPHTPKIKEALKPIINVLVAAQETLTLQNVPQAMAGATAETTQSSEPIKILKPLLAELDYLIKLIKHDETVRPAIIANLKALVTALEQANANYTITDNPNLLKLFKDHITTDIIESLKPTFGEKTADWERAAKGCNTLDAYVKLDAGAIDKGTNSGERNTLSNKAMMRALESADKKDPAIITFEQELQISSSMLAITGTIPAIITLLESDFEQPDPNIAAPILIQVTNLVNLLDTQQSTHVNTARLT